ncbi:Gfo/Idh/MocA family oxidoreductase [Treponema pectinovorum]|uniref:Gfo/Idh/MocA family oxidoreductase n=1 Tax=Treponema pectinovorum TaxID=164 RepID=UPI0011C8CAAD|nr:Gfo/Idh/MocA family oxidoreductase [Treponema pectinovorum]
MQKYSFIIVGSGWRSLFYVRIAKALPQFFELKALLCRTNEKAQKLAYEYNIKTSTSIEECKNLKPDFVVVAVNKADGAKVAQQWANFGFTVLMETPAAQDEQTLQELWIKHKKGKKILVAEQYIFYPHWQAILNLLKSNTKNECILGVINYVYLSFAHEYHGASLIKAILNTQSKDFSVSGKIYSFPTAQTFTRYEKFTDGKICDKKRTLALFEFSGNKVALYDFDSEQYRSPIRKNLFKIQGSRGEITNDTVNYLDEKNISHCENLVELNDEIKFKDETLYKSQFSGYCKTPLTQDEIAIATQMLSAAEYSVLNKAPLYPLEFALQDSYMAILLLKACSSCQTEKSQKMPWLQ